MKLIMKVLVLGMAAWALCSRAYAQEAASGTVNLVSVNGSGASQTFTYSISLKNTGLSNLGGFWYAWLPPDNVYDFLKAKPSAETGPAGWTALLEGQNNGFSDGNSIKWTDGGSPMTPGQTLTFEFTTTDNFTTVTGPSFFNFPTGYSYVYAGAPEAPGDNGALVILAAGTSPEPGTLGLLALGAVAIYGRRRRA